VTAVSDNPGCVVIGDADADARGPLARLLRAMGFEVREAETGPEALQLARFVRPAAVLLDIELPEISGYQVCHMLRGEFGPELPILLFSSNRIESYDKTAGLLLGATDYITKPFAPDELIARVKAHIRQAPPRAPKGTETLTRSEIRVLRLLASGVHTKVIASELAITPKTVSMHIQNTMKKLDVHTRTQAVVLAHQLGLVERNGDPDVYGHADEQPSRKRAQRPTA
jgi:DNA-binding NarL/FixJ family response regulator